MKMFSVSKPRNIIDRKKLIVLLKSLVGSSGYQSFCQNDILKCLKDVQLKGWIEIRRRFENGSGNSIQTIRENSYLVFKI